MRRRRTRLAGAGPTLSKPRAHERARRRTLWLVRALIFAAGIVALLMALKFTFRVIEAH